MQSHTESDRPNQIRVTPKGHNEQRFVLTQRVAGVEHFDDYGGDGKDNEYPS